MNNLTKLLSRPKICNETTNTVHNFMTALLGKLQAISGQFMEDDMFDFTLSELVSDLKSNYGGLTLFEVEYALNNGAKGNYGDFYGLNVKTFHTWLRMYFTSKERTDAVMQMQNKSPAKQISKKGCITDRESLKMSIEKALDDFAYYKAHKSIRDLGGITYSFLNRKGLLTLSNKEKWGFYNQAKDKLENKRDSVKSIYEVINLSMRDKIYHRNEIISLAKDLSLKSYFDKIISEGIDFPKLLKSLS